MTEPTGFAWLCKRRPCVQVLHKAPKLLDVSGDLGGAADVLLLEVRRGMVLPPLISMKQGSEGQGLCAGGKRGVQLAWTF